VVRTDCAGTRVWERIRACGNRARGSAETRRADSRGLWDRRPQPRFARRLVRFSCLMGNQPCCGNSRTSDSSTPGCFVERDGECTERVCITMKRRKAAGRGFHPRRRGSVFVLAARPHGPRRGGASTRTALRGSARAGGDLLLIPGFGDQPEWVTEEGEETASSIVIDGARRRGLGAALPHRKPRPRRRRDKARGEAGTAEGHAHRLRRARPRQQRRAKNLPTRFAKPGGSLFAFGNGGSSTDGRTFAALFAASPVTRRAAFQDSTLRPIKAVVTALGKRTWDSSRLRRADHRAMHSGRDIRRPRSRRVVTRAGT